MRLAGIEDYDGANKFLLEKFLPWRNEKYTHPAESSYIALPYGINLDTIFCNRLERTVKRKQKQGEERRDRTTFESERVCLCGG